MKRILQKFAGAMAALLLLAAPVAGAAAPPTNQTWDMRGTYTINFTCPNGCSPPAVPHYVTITSDDFLTGVFSGSGYYVLDPSYTWNVAGNVLGDSLSMYILYTGTNPGYSVSVAGGIAPNGYLSGTATDSAGTFFTWYADGLATATSFNHGQFVKGYADKAAMAQSDLGLPITH